MDEYNREKLYEEIWSEPVTVVAKRYGISDVALKKVCQKLNIPTPWVGYWQKVKAGAKVNRPKLPMSKGEHVERTAPPRGYDKYVQNQDIIKSKIQPKQSLNKITVSDQLRNPHPFVDQAYKRLKEIWRISREKDPVIHLDGDKIDIRVSKTSAHRALCIMDAVLKFLTLEGFQVQCGWKWNKHTYVNIDGEFIGFRIHERVKQVPHIKTEDELKYEKKWGSSNAPTYDHVPTGVITLTIEYYQYLPRKNWIDSEKQRLEDCLDTFVEHLKLAAAQSKIETEKKLAEERVSLEEEERRLLAAERQRAEIEKFEQLEKDAHDWHRSQIIKNYVDAIEATLDCDLPEEELTSRRDYMAWARDKIDWLNPLVAKNDSILGCRKKS